jgi:hypothetical protein
MPGLGGGGHAGHDEPHRRLPGIGTSPIAASITSFWSMAASIARRKAALLVGVQMVRPQDTPPCRKYRASRRHALVFQHRNQVGLRQFQPIDLTGGQRGGGGRTSGMTRHSTLSTFTLWPPALYDAGSCRGT